jgi:hypothetical protein
MHELASDFRLYFEGAVASVGPATFYDRSIPGNGEQQLCLCCWDAASYPWRHLLTILEDSESTLL